jgi:hypothetical protein
MTSEMLRKLLIAGSAVAMLSAAVTKPQPEADGDGDGDGGGGGAEPQPSLAPVLLIYEDGMPG